MSVSELGVFAAGKLPLSTLLPLLIPIAALELILVIVALVDVIRRTPGRVRGSKVLWIVIILVVGTLGPIAYLIAGRKEQEDGRN